MQTFVTGSTGLLGSNLVFELLNQGHSVKALVRSLAKAQAVFGNTLPQGLELVQGDIGELAGFEAHLKGCDTVFHTAAFFREYFQPGDHWATLKKFNVTATEELLFAAERQGVKRFVHTSSSGTIDSVYGDENSPPNPFAEENLYFKSKVLSEEVVKKFVARAENQMNVSMILPGWMIGPYDSAPTASGQLVLDFVHGKLPGYFEGGTSTVDARDVALAMIQAAENGKSGERYIVGGDFVAMSELVAQLRQITGLPHARRKIPKGVMLLVASLSEFWARVSGQPTLITRKGVKTLMEKQTLNSSKAKQLLGVHFRPLQESLQDEVRWYQQRGLIPDSLPAHSAAAGNRSQHVMAR